jgi:hypothetical protein
MKRNYRDQCRNLFAAAAIVAALFVVPDRGLRAERLPDPQRIATPSEGAALAEIVALMSERRTAREGLRRLDAILPRLAEPTPLRGFVQYLRGSALRQQERGQEAREAFEESIRLLPGFSGPLLAAAGLEAYDDRPGQAVDYLLRASEIDPDIVRQIPDYELNNIVTRLGAREDAARRRQLAERLFAIGWLGESLALRSSLARDLIEAKVESGDLEAARRLLPRLLNPADVRELLVENQYQSLWPDLDRWSGPRQARLWPPYLRELRAKWQASQDRQYALPYARALSEAGHYRTLVRDMLPLFSTSLDANRDYDLQWVAMPLAEALARLGRWNDIETMYAQALRAWPLGRDANALNIIANRGRLRLYAGDAEGALRDLDASIADAESRAAEVSANPLAAMHLARACALHQLGRDADAAASVRIVLQRTQEPTYAADLHLCFDRPAAARSALIAALRHEELRDDVIEYLQPEDEPPMQSDYGRTLAARRRALQSDPALLREVGKYGRVLPYALSAGAPAEEIGD